MCEIFTKNIFVNFFSMYVVLLIFFVIKILRLGIGHNIIPPMFKKVYIVFVYILKPSFIIISGEVHTVDEKISILSDVCQGEINRI